MSLPRMCHGLSSSYQHRRACSASKKHSLIFVLPFHTHSKWVFFSCTGHGDRLGEEGRGGWLQWEGKKPAEMGATKRGAAQLPAQEMMMYKTCTTRRSPWSHVGTGASSTLWRCCALRGAALFLGLAQHGSSSQPVACGCGEELSHHGICWLKNPTETK